MNLIKRTYYIDSVDYLKMFILHLERKTIIKN